MIVAHGGDTLSPSVMSGLDRGAHIVALTNLIAPDIFVPGNHEFDFGKAIFLRAHGARPNSRSMAPTCASRTARRCRASRTARMLDADGVRDRPDRPRLRAIAAHVLARGPAFRVHASTPPRRRRLRCAPKAPISSARCCTAIAATRSSCNTTRAADLLLTGHTPRPAHQLRRQVRLVESGYDAHYVTCVDVAITVHEDEGQARRGMVAAIPRDRHRDGDARSGCRGRGRALRAFAARQDGRGDLHHHGRARLGDRDRAHARSRDRQPVRRRDARRHARRRRDPQRRRHPRRQDLSAGRAPSARATYSPSCRSTTAWW